MRAIKNWVMALSELDPFTKVVLLFCVFMLIIATIPLFLPNEDDNWELVQDSGEIKVYYDPQLEVYIYKYEETGIFGGTGIFVLPAQLKVVGK